MPLKMVRKIRSDIEDSTQENFKKIPLTFIHNKGQIDSRVKYYVKGSGYGFYFTGEEVVMTFIKKSPKDDKKEDFVVESSNDNDFIDIKEENIGVAIALQFIGANPEVKIEGLEKTTGKVNYFKGKDQAKWITGLSTYEKIIYKELWQGIDLVFYGINEQLKYDFIVQPGASVEDIKFTYKGSDDTSLDKEGNLLIHNSFGVLIDERPISYQEIEGEKIDLGSDFSVQEQENGESIYGFEIGDAYNLNYPVVIDPGLIYSSFLGGSSSDVGIGIAVDDKGNVYVTGTTSSLDFPVTLGSFLEDKKGANFNSSVFITKLNSDGKGLVYSTFLGGSSDDVGSSIAVDDKGNAYVTGRTFSSDFPVTLGSFQTIYPGGSLSAFVIKINTDGTRLVYSTFLGGSSNDNGKSVAVDHRGNTYVTGSTISPDFPVTLGVFQDEKKGGISADSVFVTKINTDGTRLIYSAFLGGSNSDSGEGIAVDDKGNAYVAGRTNSSDFPVTIGAFQEEKKGGFSTSSAFVTKLNTDGSGLVYSTFLGGSGDDGSGSIAVDDKGNAYVTGSTSSSDFPVTLGTFQEVKREFVFFIVDAFVTKLNTDGSGLVYSTFLGGRRDDSGISIAVDDKGNAYVTGLTLSFDFPVTLEAFQEEKKGNSMAFLIKMSIDGTRLEYSTFLGGSSLDRGNCIAVDDNGNAYVTGETRSSDFPVTLGAFQTIYPGGNVNAFVTKLNTILIP